MMTVGRDNIAAFTTEYINSGGRNATSADGNLYFADRNVNRSNIIGGFTSLSQQITLLGIL